ncbi:MAG: S8 family serine peptidase, partial [Candidatus Cloacimonetes bacterium]|nr:S8 family serine peptidase [Candidatus Cloacimonadota bacterium]
MKMRNLLILLLLLFSISLIFARNFDPNYFHSRSIVASFKMEAIGRMDGVIEFTREDGVVRTGITSFDDLARKYSIIGMEQMHPQVKDPTWHDGKGWYLQNIYRLILSSDERMDDAVAELEKDQNLNYAEFETINRRYFVPNDPMVTQQYALERIKSYQAWDYFMGSYDVIIAITDSGVKWNHPDLRNNIWINPAESHDMSLDWTNGTVLGGDGVDDNGGTYGKVDDLVGWDFFNNDNNPMQNWANNDHGTHVAGCAAAVGNNGIGVTGTSPIASILSCKGASNTSNSTGVTNGYGQMQYAAEIGAHIINASWGGPGNGSYSNNIVNYCTNMGALVVTAAGNENTEHGVAGYNDYPADCTNALCVAATNAGDYKASFSDFGAPIDICAPGEGILSTIIANNGYDSYNGTSMSSPIAAGVAAMVKGMHPAMLPLEIKERLEQTADYIYDLNPDYEGKLGSGRLNAFAATMFDKIPNIVIDDFSIEEIEGDGDGVANPGETIRLKVQLYNYLDPYTGLAWSNATNVETKVRCTYPGVSIVDSTASYGSLLAGSSMWNNTQPFTFQTVSTLPSEPLPFELVVSSNQDAEYPYNVVLPFTVNLSLMQSGFPFNLGGASQSSPILEDLDGDGGSEIIFADHLGNIHALKANGNTEHPGFPIATGASGIVGSLAMSNLTGDPNLKVFVACLSNNNVIAIDENANILWNVPAGGTLRSGPIISDLGLN